MPFITKEERLKLETDPIANTPGQLCYIFYKRMVDTWRQETRWTTAHNIFKALISTEFDDIEREAAAWLAWQVFFSKYVMPYEDLKEMENGKI
jgi:hypothetical protein